MYLGEENSLSKAAMILEWENGHCEALSFFSIGQNFRSYETWYDCTYLVERRFLFRIIFVGFVEFLLYSSANSGRIFFSHTARHLLFSFPQLNSFFDDSSNRSPQPPSPQTNLHFGTQWLLGYDTGWVCSTFQARKIQQRRICKDACTTTIEQIGIHYDNPAFGEGGFSASS